MNLAKKTIKVNSQPSKPSIERIGNTLASSSPSGNQWFINGVKMPGETRQFLNLKELGFYQVQVIDFNGCISELSDVLVVDILGFKDIIDKFGIKIYPNPFDRNLNVKFNEYNGAKAVVRINTLLGNVIEEKIINIIGIDNSALFETGFLCQGIYILNIDINGYQLNFKIIKN